jgi:hypothetical protein
MSVAIATCRWRPPASHLAATTVSGSMIVENDDHKPAARIEGIVDRAVVFGQRVGGCPAGSDSNFTG